MDGVNITKTKQKTNKALGHKNQTKIKKGIRPQKSKNLHTSYESFFFQSPFYRLDILLLLNLLSIFPTKVLFTKCNPNLHIEQLTGEHLCNRGGGG